MDWWFGWMEREGLAMARIVLQVGPFLLALRLGIWAGDKWRKWIGWLVGLLTLFVLYSMFIPVTNLIDERGCEINPDYEDCY